MKKIGTWFLQGLLAIAPIALTVYVLYWLATSAESLLGGAISYVIGERYYLPGMGVAAGFLLTLGVGILLRLWLFRKVFDLVDTILNKIPGIQSVYGSIRDLIGFFDSTKQREFDQTVMVTVGDPQVRLMGLVTRDDFSDLPDGIGDDKTVAVYLPMSYQLGGFTVMVPKSKVQAVDMKVDQTLKFLLTAGVTSETKGKNGPKDKSKSANPKSGQE
ncbi:MAG: DUF502 domain-containing protein [Sedimentisphaerales bacterium]|nr:DUF502 domain-containing protein [Sedimentisphaerales bacterium]